MSGFLGVLAFIAFIAFIIGMIKPSIVVFWSKRKTRGLASLYLVAMVLFGIFAGVSSSSSSLPKAPTTSGVSISSQQAISTSPQTSASPSSAAISKPYNTQLSSGHYTSGIDFPAGTYDIVAVKGSGNVTTTNMYSGGLNAIMGIKGENNEKEYKNIQMPFRFQCYH